jgi:hemolysin activation/secretion protein
MSCARTVYGIPCGLSIAAGILSGNAYAVPTEGYLVDASAPESLPDSLSPEKQGETKVILHPPVVVSEGNVTFAPRSSSGLITEVTEQASNTDVSAQSTLAVGDLQTEAVASEVSALNSAVDENSPVETQPDEVLESRSLSKIEALEKSNSGNLQKVTEPEAISNPTMTSRMALEGNAGHWVAQATPPPVNNVLPDIQRSPQVPEEEIELPPILPSLDELFRPEIVSPPDETLPSSSDQETVVIQRFEVSGNTVFSEKELATATESFTGRPLTFVEVLQARSAITQLYLEHGYITSGAIFPPQQLQADGVARIEVIEGSLEEIAVQGTQRLNPGYISSRLAVGIPTPVNRADILERLQLLLLNPLIESISADLQTGSRPGTNRLVVSVTEADSFKVSYGLDNNRSPSVGSIRHQLQLNQANLLGLGDSLSIGYSLTSGSGDLDFAYSLPINPRDGTLTFLVNRSDSAVVESPFDVLQIGSDATRYELMLRQPLIQTPTQELALGLTASYQQSQTSLGLDNIGPFPLAPGADSQGRTTVSALRFFQEWTQRSADQVVALRSQFSLGLGVLGATVNERGPDSRFFSWQGQAQWVRSLGTDTLLLLKGSVQLTPDSLLSQEQFGLGGQSTVRGYRQNQMLTDNGVLASVELRLPVLGRSRDGPLLQVAPFLDMGYGWNVNGDNPNPNALIGIGTGLLFSINNLTARLDWGIPLNSVNSRRDSLQENGLYFSLNYSFF